MSLCRYIDMAQLFHQSSFIDCANPIQYDLSFSPLKSAAHPRWICLSSGCHWGSDNCCNMCIHFIWRDNQTGPRLLDFTPYGRIKIDQVNLETTGYHVHSVSSQCVGTLLSNN
jgi:hypothetical protein